MESNIYQISKRYVGPVIYDFVSWIIDEAKEREIKTLYFLARDGFVLKKAAELIITQKKIDIQCKYFYCSRCSLRIPSYHLIGEEALDLLLLGGYYLTASSVLERLFLNDSEKEDILKEINFDLKYKDKVMSKTTFLTFSQKLRDCTLFRRKIQEHSLKAYPNTIGYIRQEGMLNEERIAIVDSGWTGSMQRSLRQLLDSTGRKYHITGFYFGMYALPKKEKGEYLTWYFGAHNGKSRKITFNNNLFECMLSAPHGMTISYAKKENEYEPVFTETSFSDTRKQMIQNQSDGIIDGVKKCMLEREKKEFKEKTALRETKRIFSHIMLHPTRNEVETYSAFTFCDDVSDGYQLSLTNESQMKSLKQYMILRRVKRKFHKSRDDEWGEAELYWPYGTIAFLPAYKQWWYRLNVRFWDWLRFSLY